VKKEVFGSGFFAVMLLFLLELR